MSSKHELGSNTNNQDEKAQQEIRNLRLTEEKIQRELLDLRRSYLLRNPQLLTASITSIGAIIAAFILIGDNYYKTREELNQLQSEKTARLNVEAQQARENAKTALLDAGAKIKAAEDIRADADRIISQSNKQVEAAKQDLRFTKASLTALEKERQSLEYAAKAEVFVSQKLGSAARDAALIAWNWKHTASARQAVIDAHSLPVAKLQIDEYVFCSLVAFSPDGRHIVTVYHDGTARLWEASTGKQLVHMKVPDETTDAEFSPDGQRIVTAGGDGTARVWEASTGRQLSQMNGHNALVISASFSPDGKQVLTTSDDHTVRVWEASTGNQVAKMNGSIPPMGKAAFSPDGQWVVAVCSDGAARVWEAWTGKQMAQTTVDQGMGTAAFSPDGKRLVTAGFSTTTRQWDATTGMKLMEMKVFGSPVTSAVFSPNGQQVLTTSFDGAAGIWDASSGERLVYIDPKYSLRHAVFSPNGQRVVIFSHATFGDPGAGVWETSTGKQLIGIQANGFETAAFSPDGRWLVIVTTGKEAEVFRILSSADVERFFTSRR
jgi:WD40 repeat protein